jgi:tetratricopeptide (TPR) repeat protein
MTATRNRLILVLLILLIFGQAVSFSFLIYDDPINITKNPIVKSPSLHHLVTAWERPIQHLYIPVTYTAWIGISSLSDYFFGKLHPGLFHLANILLHIANSLLVYGILINVANKLSENNKQRTNLAALFATLIFSLHPVQVESVVWVTGFKDLLSAFFFFLATYILITSPHTAEQGKSWPLKQLAIASGLYLLAILAKPQAIIFPFFIYILLKHVLHRNPTKDLISFILLWIITGLLIAFLTKNVQPNPFQVSFLQRIHIAANASLFYISKIIWPHPQLIDYGKPLVSQVTSSFPWIAIIIISLFTVFLYFIRDGKIHITIMILFLVCVAPILGFIPFNFQRISIVADRYLYISLFTLSLFCSIFIKKYFYTTTIFTTISIICIYAFLSFQYGAKWRDTVTLMTYTLGKNPVSKIANQNLGVALMREGKMRESIPYLKKAIDLVPTDMTTHFNLALSYACIGNIMAARQEKKMLMNKAPKLGTKLTYILPRIENTCPKKAYHSVHQRFQPDTK